MLKCRAHVHHRPIHTNTIVCREHCDNFFNDAKAFFRYIEGIRSSPYRSTKRKKIRIVLLDSGIDAQEWVMEEAIDEGLIDPAECESFVDSPWNKADDMHGTNVAELATRAAPAADIVIGKVCEYRDKLEDLLPRLAKVSFPLQSSSSKA